MAEPNPNNPWDTAEHYWAENFTSRPYVIGGNAFFEQYLPAFRFGHEAAQEHADREWDDAEADLRAQWDRLGERGEAPPLSWDDARPAVRDSWDHARRPPR